MFTGLATLLGAIAGLLVTLHQLGYIGKQTPPTPPQPSSSTLRDDDLARAKAALTKQLTDAEADRRSAEEEVQRSRQAVEEARAKGDLQRAAEAENRLKTNIERANTAKGRADAAREELMRRFGKPLAPQR